MIFRLTKPLSFADCIGDELPYGWEMAFDSKFGVYYIDHIHKKNQIIDPRISWRNLQINMLNNYLQQAGFSANKPKLSQSGSIEMSPGSSCSFSAQSDQEINNYQIKSATNNNNQINNQNSSHIPAIEIKQSIMLNPSSTSTNVKINPLLSNQTLLGQSLTDAKKRVAQLKRELDANHNLLHLIDKYYGKGENRDAEAVEV